MIPAYTRVVPCYPCTILSYPCTIPINTRVVLTNTRIIPSYKRAVLGYTRVIHRYTCVIYICMSEIHNLIRVNHNSKPPQQLFHRRNYDEKQKKGVLITVKSPHIIIWNFLSLVMLFR